MLARQVIGYPDTSGIFACHDAGARWRTDRTSGVSVRELHSARSEPVQIRRLIELAAITTQVSPAKVIHQDDDEVQLSGWRPVRQSQSRRQPTRFLGSFVSSRVSYHRSFSAS